MVAVSRALTVAHNLRDPAAIAAIAEAMALAGATPVWREVGVDLPVQVRTDPPDALLLELQGPALLVRELLERLARETRRPPVPAVIIAADDQPGRAVPAFDVVPCTSDVPLDPARVARSLITVGRRAQAWRGRYHGGLESVTLHDLDFARLADLISRRTAIQLENGKSQNIGEVVARRMRAGAFREVGAYLSWLGRDGANHGELENLLPGLVVGETSFFRTPAHFSALRQVVVPDLVRRRPRGLLRAWSAGCASGEEAYSLALTLREEVADAGPERVRVTATDIDHTALERARRGVYRLKDVRKVPPALLQSHFVQLGDEYHVDHPVRQLVEVDWFNLNADWRTWSRRFRDPLDLIFCENVIIYFRKDLIPPLLERFAAVLRPGGYLFLGYSETLFGVDHPFEDVTHGETFFYRKPARRTAPATAAAAAPAGPATTAGGAASSAPAVHRRITGLLRTVPAARPPAPTPRPVTTPAPELAEQKTAARELLLAGDYAAAAAAYDAILSADPDSRGTRLALAFLALKRGDDPAATTLLEAVQADHPVDPEVFYFRALAAMQRGEAAAARGALERALYLEADYVPAHFQLGELAAGEGRLADAARHFRNAAEAQRRAPAAAVVSFEGVVRAADITDVCERNAATLARAAGEEGA